MQQDSLGNSISSRVGLRPKAASAPMMTCIRPGLARLKY
jgi:hypothetical protein